MVAWLRYVIAFIVGCHGFIYLRIGPFLPGMVKEWTGGSWLLGGAVNEGQFKAIVRGLHIAAGVLTFGCAAAIALAPALPGWWRPLAIGSALAGVAAFAAFWDGQTRFLAEEGFIGAMVSLILLAVAIVSG
jgi:hypothetical protein